MTSPIRKLDKANKLASEAIAYDNQHKYQEALPIYIAAIETFKSYMECSSTSICDS